MTNAAGAAGSPVYLDSASSEPLHPAARETLLAALEQGYADPRRLHGPARAARLLLDNARAVVAECLGRPPRRGHLHRLGHRRRAPRAARPGRPARVRHGTGVVHSAVEHSAVLHAAAWAAAATADAGAVPVDRLGRVAVADLARGRRRPGGRRRRRAGGQPRGRHRSSRSPRWRPLPRRRTRSSSTPAPRWAGCRCPTAGPRWPAPRTSGAARPGVGVLLVRKGARWRNPFPGDDRIDERATGFENVPAALAAAAALRAVVAERDEVGARQRGPGRPDPRRGGRDPRRRGGRRPGRPAPPPGHLLLPLRRRRGAGAPSSTGAGSASPAARRAPPRRSTPSHVLEAMGVLTHGNVRVSLTRDTTAERGRRVPRGAARGGARRSAPRWACEPGRRDLELDCRGMLCPLPVIELGRRLADVPVGGLVAVRRRRRRGPGRRPGVVPDARRRSTSARTPPPTARRATWCAGS